MTKMPKTVKDHFKAKSRPAKKGGVPAGLKKWHDAHPRSQNAHKPAKHPAK